MITDTSLSQEGGELSGKSTEGIALPSAIEVPVLGRICILVLGMHRSGTSALTRAINLFGAELPKNMLGANPTNPAGHWEPTSIIELNNQILSEAGTRWNDWRNFDIHKIPRARLENLEAEIADVITLEYENSRVFVLKDPRIARLIPLYATVFRRLEVSVRYVLIHRNPLSVIASHEVRDGFLPGFTALLWLRHQIEMESATRDAVRTFMSYEELLEHSGAVMTEEFLASIGLPSNSPSRTKWVIGGHFDKAQQHHSYSEDKLVNNPGVMRIVKDVYLACRRLEKDPADPDLLLTFDTIKHELNNICSAICDVLHQEFPPA